MKLSEYAKLNSIHYRTAWERFRTGKIPGAYLDDTGHVVVPHPNEARRQKAAVYARVSSHPQREDLDRQAERLVQYATARGMQVVAVVKETASGVSDTRPKLTKLLGSDEWGTLVVEHRDRLTRMGFTWFEVLLAGQGRAVDVANPAEDDRAELMADLMAIVYSFAARLYGLRRARVRTDRLIAALAAEADTDTDADGGGSDG